jgi:hypothetical protein
MLLLLLFIWLLKGEAISNMDYKKQELKGKCAHQDGGVPSQEHEQRYSQPPDHGDAHFLDVTLRYTQHQFA